MNIDFTLGLSSRGLRNFALWYVGIKEVQSSITGLAQAGETLDHSLQKGLVTFNGYGNALKAYKTIQDEIIAGKLKGATEEYMQAAELFHRSGVQITSQNRQMLSDLAAGTGKNVDEVAKDITSAIHGSMGALEDYGLKIQAVKQATYASIPGTVQYANAIMHLVQAQKQFNGVFQEAPRTFADVFKRINEGRKKFFQSIIGSDTDPNSLSALIKNTLIGGLNYLREHADDIKMVALTITVFLKSLVNVVSFFAKATYEGAKSIFEFLGYYTDHFKVRVAAFTLYFGFLGEQVSRFYHNHKKFIDALIGGFALFALSVTLLEVPAFIINRFVRLHTQIAMLTGSMSAFNVVAGTSGFLGIIKGIGKATLGLNFAGVLAGLRSLLPALSLTSIASSAAAAGITALEVATGAIVVVGAIAAIAGAAYFIWKHLDGAVASAKAFGLALAFVNPLLGTIVYLGSDMVQHWRETVALVQNVGVLLYNIGVMAGQVIGKVASSVGKSIVGALRSFLGDSIVDFVEDLVKKVVSGIGSIFSGGGKGFMGMFGKDGFSLIKSLNEFIKSANDSNANQGFMGKHLLMSGVAVSKPTPETPNAQSNTPVVPAVPPPPKVQGVFSSNTNNNTNIAPQDSSTVNVMPGAIIVNGSENPEATAKAVNEALQKKMRNAHPKRGN